MAVRKSKHPTVDKEVRQLFVTQSVPEREDYLASPVVVTKGAVKQLVDPIICAVVFPMNFHKIRLQESQTSIMENGELVCIGLT